LNEIVFSIGKINIIKDYFW